MSLAVDDLSPTVKQVALPDGGTCTAFYDWRRVGWTTDLPGSCFQPAHRNFCDLLDALTAQHTPTR